MDILGHYGDLCFSAALAVYLLAMVLHAVEHAGQARVRPAADRVTPAGAAADRAAEPDDPVDGTGPPEHGAAVPVRPFPERAGRMAVSVTVLGAALHLAALLLRGLAAHRPPWGNMYEFTMAITFVAVASWLVVLGRDRAGAVVTRRLGVFVLLPVVLLMFVGGTVLYTQSAPVVPALRSYWLAVHVTAAVVASGVLLVAGVASVLHLVRVSADRRERVGGFAARLPDAATLDRVAYRATRFAFPVWTFAIIAGAIWAEAAWGRYWGWDPKETTAFVAWVVYAGYLHARATAGWRGGRAAWVNIAGFAVMVFNLFFVNLVVTGLHSYAGVG
jgi:cytochrome c-type biogenesis protein CcsB